MSICKARIFTFSFRLINFDCAEVNRPQRQLKEEHMKAKDQELDLRNLDIITEVAATGGNRAVDVSL